MKITKTMLKQIILEEMEELMSEEELEERVSQAASVRAGGTGGSPTSAALGPQGVETTRARAQRKKPESRGQIAQRTRQTGDTASKRATRLSQVKGGRNLQAISAIDALRDKLEAGEDVSPITLKYIQDEVPEEATGE